MTTDSSNPRELIEALTARAGAAEGEGLSPADIAAYAQAIARAAHEGQVDKAGQAYIAHPARLAAAVRGDDAVAVAWLHDVVEDTAVTLSDLETLFPPEIVAAVDAITRRDGETPEEYYARIRTTPLAVTVKLADIADNADPARLALLDEKTRNRLTRKYARSLNALTSA